MTHTCSACGIPLQGGISIGGAILCRDHAEDVRAEIDRQRKEGGHPNAAGIARRMYREMYSAGNYLLRDVPKELMESIGEIARGQKTDMRAVIIQAMRAYATKA